MSKVMMKTLEAAQEELKALNAKHAELSAQRETLSGPEKAAATKEINNLEASIGEKQDDIDELQEAINSLNNPATEKVTGSKTVMFQGQEVEIPAEAFDKWATVDDIPDAAMETYARQTDRRGSRDENAKKWKGVMYIKDIEPKYNANNTMNAQFVECLIDGSDIPGNDERPNVSLEVMHMSCIMEKPEIYVEGGEPCYRVYVEKLKFMNRKKWKNQFQRIRFQPKSVGYVQIKKYALTHPEWDADMADRKYDQARRSENAQRARDAEAQDADALKDTTPQQNGMDMNAMMQFMQMMGGMMNNNKNVKF